MGGGGKNAASDQARQQRADEEARQARVRAGMTRIDDVFSGQFNDQFYTGIRDGFLDFARPQLDDQFEDAREQMTFNLARSGLLDSSVRGERAADLQREYDTNLTTLRSQALDREGQARGRVEDARGDLVRTLQATGDADAAANSALARAQALATPEAYSPIGQLFNDTSSILASQIALERAEAARDRYALPGPGVGTQLFGSRPGAVRTTR